ncbi:fibronectin type III domain-containing protein [Acidiluteibacter ferrifornacis]|uniref:Fibronectin type-III domain-containing protein n=1 Tax=Acidiluteibacter ferrifornacis TaxID=2692424 RepID=A0A6N9NDT2_9FLAO|nr:hypothetical protein [Acidiluteibacter ferrifornacis]NBG64758.1 hypothetical protein [Acidiluteibacter ferrifornacis]
MKRKYLFYLLVVLALGAFVSCDEFIEEDLEGKVVILTNPNDSLVTTYSTQVFNWDEIDGADWYNLQIVSKSFSQLDYYVLDTIVETNQFLFNLTPGVYQWRVRGENSGYVTPYSTRTIQIDSTSDLNGVTVILLTPSKLYSNNGSIGYRWQSIYNADQYVFEIRNENEFGTLVYMDTLTGTEVAEGAIVLNEGNYSWGVKAINSNSSTNYTYKALIVDTTAPRAPGIVNVDSLQGNNYTIQWNRTSNDVAVDSLYLYSNQSLTNIVLNKELLNPNYSDSLVDGTYYWKVKSIDKAENIGLFSKLNKLVIN